VNNLFEHALIITYEHNDAAVISHLTTMLAYIHYKRRDCVYANISTKWKI